MKRVLTLTGGVLVLMLTLVACTTEVTAERMQFALSDSGTIGYEVSPTGAITVETRFMRFRNAAGAYGVTLTEYRIAFFDENDDPIDIGGSEQSGSMNMFVPAGIQCDVPDEVYGCSLGAEGWRFAPGAEVVTPQGYQLLPASIAFAHIAASFPVGWYGEIEFTGFDTLSRAFTSDAYQIAITAPD